jgi:hypothetical protein
MYATAGFGDSISKMVRVLLAAVLLVGFTSPPLDGIWREAPEYLPLFTPPRAPVGAYSTYVSKLDIDAAVTRIRRDPAAASVPGAWQVHALIPFDAFGQSGGYDRWKVARLYGAKRARVARGPRMENGQVVESWTLVSPYPDALVQRLEPGTLLIILRVP